MKIQFTRFIYHMIVMGSAMSMMITTKTTHTTQNTMRLFCSSSSIALRNTSCSHATLMNIVSKNNSNSNNCRTGRTGRTSSSLQCFVNSNSGCMNTQTRCYFSHNSNSQRSRLGYYNSLSYSFVQKKNILCFNTHHGPSSFYPRSFYSTSSSSSSLSATKTNNNNNNQESIKTKKKKSNNNKNNVNTGGLRRLPVVKAPIEIINRAIKTIKRDVRADTNIKNARNRARKHATVTLDTLTKELCVPLRDVVNGYKHEISNLHSFEKVVADLTVKARQKKDGVSLLNLLNDIHECRKEILACGKDWVAKAKYAESAKEAMDTMVQGEKALVELFDALVGEPLTLLIDLQKSLRTTPAVRLDTPAVVLVGAPNVGKSSIVRAISSATPEVNNYPFTTRGMTLGHVQVFWKDQTTTAAAVIPEVDEKGKGRFQLDDTKSGIAGSYAFTQLCQVMDSPGLLVRDSDTKRNEMESLTLAAMQHLPTAVMYVMDLSGGAGDKCSSVEDQIQLRKEVRARFPRRPWIDVVSKYDLGLVDGAREQLEDVLNGAPYLELSIKEGTGVDELRDEVMRMLGEVRVVLDAMAAVDSRSARQS